MKKYIKTTDPRSDYFFGDMLNNFKRKNSFIKILACLACVFCAATSLFCLKTSTKNDISVAFADNAHTTVKSLEYFELEKPISIFKSDDKYYIIESDLAVIYHDDAYDTVDLAALGVKNAKSAQKCGNHLLILADNGLFALNLSTFSAKAITQNVVCFSVCEKTSNGKTVFAICKNGENRPALYQVTDKNNFIYSALEQEYTPMNGNATAIALFSDLSFYYATDGALYQNIPPKTSVTADKNSGNVEFAQCADQKLYFKSNGSIYSIENSENKTVVLSSSVLPSGWQGFFVSGDYAYICDYENDKIIEYSLASKTASGFEISFTKIVLPDNFAISQPSSPSAVTINSASELYAVDLKKSLKNRYFCYEGSYVQKNKRDYLIIGDVGGKYYLIAGDCFALIEKNKNYTTHSLASTTLPEKAYLTSDAAALKFPAHDALSHYDNPPLDEFTSFSLKKDDCVQIISALRFGDYVYALVSLNGQKGYVPASFLTESIYVPAEKTQFYSAKIYHKTAELFADENLTVKLGEIDKYSPVSVYTETANAFYVKDKNGNAGYVQKDCVQNPAYYTVRTSIILIIVGISFLITALYFEKRFLYSRKKIK